MSKQHSLSYILRILAVGLALIVIPAIWLLTEARSDQARRDESSLTSYTAPVSTLRSVSLTELEERYGIRPTLIGVTAAGGMVDFRFKVLDAEKARILTKDHSLMPVLTVQNSGTRLALPGNGMHSMTFYNDKVYYILFGNPKGEIKPGTLIEVAFGDMQVGPILAQ
jgi:hypothetical protein